MIRLADDVCALPLANSARAGDIADEFLAVSLGKLATHNLYRSLLLIKGQLQDLGGYTAPAQINAGSSSETADDRAHHFARELGPLLRDTRHSATALIHFRSD